MRALLILLLLSGQALAGNAVVEDRRGEDPTPWTRTSAEAAANARKRAGDQWFLRQPLEAPSTLSRALGSNNLDFAITFRRYGF